jgi:hypothetical protein
MFDRCIARPAVTTMLTLAALGVGCDRRSPVAPSAMPTPTLTPGPASPAAVVTTAIAPTTGPTYGNTPVVITGDGFQPGIRVSLGDTPANVTAVSRNRIEATTGPRDAGPVDVVVSNPDGGIARLSDGYVFEVRPPGAPLAITAIVPDLGAIAGGTLVRLWGSGFEPGMTVTLGGPVMRPRVAGDGGVYLLTPPGAAGPRDVVVTNPDGQSATRAAGYTYSSPASFDLNGEWEGRAGDHWDFDFRFTVRGGVVTGVTCEQTAYAFTTPLLVQKDTFSAVERGVVVFAGAFQSESQGTGTVFLPPCVLFGRGTHWEGAKVRR